MSLSSVPYFFARCAGKSTNLFDPKCQTLGPGSFDENDASQKAIEQGWILGKNCYCPAHRDQAPATDTTEAPGAPAAGGRRSRRKPTPEFGLPVPEASEEQNHG